MSHLVNENNSLHRENLSSQKEKTDCHKNEERPKVITPN